VHNVLTDSFLAAYQAYGPEELSRSEADRFVEEQTRIGALLGADPLPTTAADLRTWIDEHPDLATTGELRSAIDFLRSPPLARPTRAGYSLLLQAAATTLSPRLREMTGITPVRHAGAIGTTSVNGLRWALGSSPSWHLSLIRAGAPVPDGMFRQPLPAGAQV
jgi:uncharacterized protein (DUF2236 family)